MANTKKPASPQWEPVISRRNHNTWFESHHAWESGSIPNAYYNNLNPSSSSTLQDLLQTSQLKRSNARKEIHPNAGKFGTAGVSGVHRRNAVKERHSVTFGTAGISGIQRRNAVRERHPHAGYFGTAGVSGVQRRNAIREQHPHAGCFGTAGVSGLKRTDGANKWRRRQGELAVEIMGSFVDSTGARRSSRVAGISPTTSPTFDQFHDPLM